MVSGITTGLALLGLALSSLRGFSEFGVVGAIALAAILLAMLVVMPPALIVGTRCGLIRASSRKMMVGLAIPFAIRLRRGGLAISFGASLAIALTYLVVFSAAIALGHAGHLNPVTAAWFANALFFATGLVLFFRTPT